jgi:hypothetical protein
MKGHFIKVELNSLDPKNFDNIQYFFTKFKSLPRESKYCGIDKSKEEKQLILTIMEKFGPQYSVFISTFHSDRFITGATWTMPSLSKFIEDFTQEQDNLI